VSDIVVSWLYVVKATGTLRFGLGWGFRSRVLVVQGVMNSGDSVVCRKGLLGTLRFSLGSGFWVCGGVQPVKKMRLEMVIVMEVRIVNGRSSDFFSNEPFQK